MERVEDLKARELLGGKQDRFIIISAAVIVVIIVIIVIVPTTSAASVILAPLPAALHLLGQILNTHGAIEPHTAPLEKPSGLFRNFARLDHAVAILVEPAEHPAGVKSAAAPEPAAAAKITAAASEAATASEASPTAAKITTAASEASPTAAKISTPAESTALVTTAAAALCFCHVGSQKDSGQQNDNCAEAIHVQRHDPAPRWTADAENHAISGR
ncbi:MAG: hypothetical protein WDZ59_13040 [Pirellulales bacterium]